MLHALVVDDEPAARSGLAAMIRADPDFAEVSECGDRESAVQIIRARRPQMVFLDIQLSPGMGFDVIEEVGVSAMPQTVFVTAFDRFALKAFETAAVDYVLKPVDPVRLAAALARAKVRVIEANVASASHQLTSLVANIGTSPSRPIAVADGERTLLFEPNEVVRIEAADYYANLFARGRSWLVRESLDAFEARLPSPPFFRIHRSAIVNLRYVVEVTRETRHRHLVRLRDGSSFPVSEERRKALEGWLWQQH